MRFSELVELREQLIKRYTTESITNEVKILETTLLSIANNTPPSEFTIDVHNLSTDLTRSYDLLKQHNTRYQDLLKHLEQKIEQESAKFFTDNYTLELKYSSPENIRNVRVMKLSDDVRAEIQQRIQLYTDWRYPVMEIGCRDGEWTQYLVAGDPLYIVDHHQEFIDSATAQFSDQYRNRVRVYLTGEHDLSALPENQMGFVFCWNFLNYSSLDTVKEYLKEVKRTLRPGGVFLFSYNDGDRPGCAGMAENFFMSYIPRRMLIPLCESLGFEIVCDHARERTISWIEVRKPGTLTTNKAHQVMGEIKLVGR